MRRYLLPGEALPDGAIILRERDAVGSAPPLRSECERLITREG
jgi:hypothetical protein